jgi:hypothetical protein
VGQLTRRSRQDEQMDAPVDPAVYARALHDHARMNGGPPPRGVDRVPRTRAPVRHSASGCSTSDSAAGMSCA